LQGAAHHKYMHVDWIDFQYMYDVGKCFVIAFKGERIARTVFVSAQAARILSESPRRSPAFAQ